MAPRAPTFSVRSPYRSLVLAGLAMSVLAGVGCNNGRCFQRRAERPIFVRQAPATVVAPAAAPCPSGAPCAGGAVAVPSAVSIPAPAVVRPGFSGPAVLTPPPAPIVPGGPVGVPAPAGDPAVNPAGGNPGLNQGDEPPLEGLKSTPRSYQSPQLPDGTGNSQSKRFRGIPGASPASARGSSGGAAWNASEPSASNSAPTPALAARVVDLTDDPADLLQPPKAERAWQYIVVHHSAHASGGLTQIDGDHKKVKGLQGCGYHFVIGNGTESGDGRIEVARRWSDQKPGAHCRDARETAMNDYGIGICLIGNFDDGPPSAKQVEATRALVSYLASRYQIAPDHIGTHDQIATGVPDCPGSKFPREILVLGSAGSLVNR
ncbi:MAG: N-acetylmuramoyl-L-alanine amidase [Isosphaeraceae bacterium]